MDRRDDSFFYGFNQYPSVAAPVQPHHPASLQHRPSHHLPPLTPYPSNNFNIPNNQIASHSPPSAEELHEKITVQTPQPKQRRRRGANAVQASPGDVEMQTPARPTRPSPNQGVVVRTKFPVARIKRIMQADEDVGKVAQVTPVIVSKALELFMVALCGKASEQARLRSSKRITAAHLKQAVAQEEQFDFLADILSKVPDVPLPSESSGHNGDSDDNGSGAPGSVKKPRKPRTRKLKEEES